MPTDSLREHWNQRAALGSTAGTRDLLAVELEHRAILAAVREYQPSTILEVGCGLGELARLITSTMHGVDYLAIDNASEMIGAAKAQPRNARLRFACLGIDDLPKGHFDCAITERMLINLPSWEAQKAAIHAIAERLNPGGHFLMCENSQDGLDAINRGRLAVGLPEITPPWHNRYLRDSELEDLGDPLRCEHYSATYYFLSRIVNAKLAHDSGREPEYDALVNQLALKLPAQGPWAQGRLWVWRKPG